jgi:hypothetical protein
MSAVKKMRGRQASKSNNKMTPATKSSEQAGESPSSNRPTKLPLHSEHQKLQALFAEFTKDPVALNTREEVLKIVRQLISNISLEEHLVLPALRGKIEETLVDQLEVENDIAKILMADIQSAGFEDGSLKAKLTVLFKLSNEHMEGLLRDKEGIFARSRAEGVDLDAVIEKVSEHHRDEPEQVTGHILFVPALSILRLPQRSLGRISQEDRMSSRQRGSMRDDRGRFSDDDRDNRSRSGGREENNSRSRFRDEDSDRGRFSSERGQGQGGWFGDSRGHAEAARRGWEEREGSSGRNRDREDQDGRDRGGWFGDPEGHSEASRRGWEGRDREESRGGSRGRDRDYDNGRERGNSRGRDRDDDYGRDRGGWFGDSEGHSEAARRGWEERGGSSSRGWSRSRDEEDGLDRGGWFGDREGHSEAARRGWQTREREESRGGRGRDRDDDDNRRSSRGRDGGGWFGDSEGHSEAARRGWESREREGSQGSRGDRGRDRDDDDDNRRSSRGRDGGGWFGDSEGHSEAARRGWANR